MKKANNYQRKPKRRNLIQRVLSVIFPRRKKVRESGMEEFQQDLYRMTNWQNSQWLRAGASRHNTGLFLGMTKWNRPMLLETLIKEDPA